MEELICVYSEEGEQKLKLWVVCFFKEQFQEYFNPGQKICVICYLFVIEPFLMKNNLMLFESLNKFEASEVQLFPYQLINLFHLKSTNHYHNHFTFINHTASIITPYQK